jgi:RimJ/RimL family protein N-acetyltransferase
MDPAPLYPPLPGALKPPLPPHLLAPHRGVRHRVATLRDGGRVLLRPLRPSDRDVYLRSFDHLSSASRYMRFFSPKNALTERELHHFLDVDHHDHEAIAAIDLATAEGIGVARFVRDHDDPRVAEVSVTVVDEHQGRGLGALLLERLAERAADEGVERLRASVLADNHRMLDLIRSRWPQHRVCRGPASVLELEFGVRSAPELRSPR